MNLLPLPLGPLPLLLPPPPGFTGGIPKTLELTKYTIVPVLISIFYAAGYFPLKCVAVVKGAVVFAVAAPPPHPTSDMIAAGL